MPVPQPALDLLAATYDGPERWTAIGRELFIDFVESIGTSMLPAAMVRARFPTEATGRNWNTLAKLAELTAP